MANTQEIFTNTMKALFDSVKENVILKGYDFDNWDGEIELHTLANGRVVFELTDHSFVTLYLNKCGIYCRVSHKD